MSIQIEIIMKREMIFYAESALFRLHVHADGNFSSLFPLCNDIGQRISKVGY